MSLASRFPVTIRVLAGLALAAASCGTPSPTSSPVPGTVVPATVAPTPSPGASGPGSPPPATPATPPAPERPDLAAARVTSETVAGGLVSPLFVTGSGDGSGRLFVVEQGGRVRVVQGGQVQSVPFLDIADRVTAGGERGLLGLAFPPGFGPGRPAIYVHYSDRDGNTTVSSFRVEDAGAGAADAASEATVLTQAQPYANHNGGWIGFDRGGMLLIGLGDGGSGGDPEDRASNLGTLLGKMLRIDVLAASAGKPYGIPADNPFLGRPGARPEILDYGLRNPFRDSIDPATGDLWIGDVGQNAWEEVDVARAGQAGLDFGWRRWEGRHCYNPPTGCDPAGVTMPVAEYPHAAGCAVIGGVVYHGTAMPALRGAYLFSDYCSGTVWAIDAALDAAQAPIVLVETGRQVSSIGTGDDGEVYLTDLAKGELLRLVPAG